ncbi:hypothetical protein [Streptomyces nigrescens]|uniref:Secreted protein n=1 Tax=Streptomyces nigrescens TaxID=1920 RepID=A0ABY7IUV7_STRNI|nr:hypothetical protein [Streptomyces nigrescens]WAU02073.1 hypothetical protein STRNI_000023 [Streptomyces nigrescens]
MQMGEVHMLRAKHRLVLVGSTVSAALLMGGVTPAHAASRDNVGEMIAIPSGESQAATYARVLHRAQEIHAFTPANKKCTGVWKHSVANVDWDRTPRGTVRWSFKLTGRARAKLGPAVTVSMPNAWVNNHSINAPYGPHSRVSTYDFHGSMNKYNRKGSSKKHTIRTKNKITFFWLIKSHSNPRAGATRYITCQVPPKNSG